MTERKHITCPETGHLEQVELEHTRLGILVTGCSRYRDGALACPRECARRMDRRERMSVDDHERVLIVLANMHDDASRIACALAEELASDQLTVELADGTQQVPPLADYDAVVIGAHARLGRLPGPVHAYICEHQDELAALPAFFFAVGRLRLDADLPRRWQPRASARFGDGSPRSEISAFARQISDEIPAPALPCSM